MRNKISVIVQPLKKKIYTELAHSSLCTIVFKAQLPSLSAFGNTAIIYYPKTLFVQKKNNEI